MGFSHLVFQLNCPEVNPEIASMFSSLPRECFSFKVGLKILKNLVSSPILGFPKAMEVKL